MNKEGIDHDRGVEKKEWLDSIEAVATLEGSPRATQVLHWLEDYAREHGVSVPPSAQTPYINTIKPEEEPPYPGNLEIEVRIRNMIRWNAMAMVVRANKANEGIGGHISTFASCASLYEVGQNHFFRGRDHPNGGDHIYFQGHASPGNYARAFLEGRMTEEQLMNFRRETKGKGLSSYPHPWLMPKFWEFPTVSMGLGPIQAIYRARFMKYLENRGLKEKSDARVWAFVGDGETDEPEALGSITLAVREKLDNLIFVVNCNLQRLDGPVRGNGKIIQELEAVFGGVGWNVIKIVWGSEWDPLFKQDTEETLKKRLTKMLDGEFQKLHVDGGSAIREKIFGIDSKLKAMVQNLSDQQIWKMRVGGHDFKKIHAAFDKAVKHKGAPTVILAQTIKGYGLGAAGEGMNITHAQKKLNEDELKKFRDRFQIPISDPDILRVPFYKPPESSPEIQYIKEQRQKLGGFVPERRVHKISVSAPRDKLFDEFFNGSQRPVATTMSMARLLSKLLADPQMGKLVVPIVPDEARTFGMHPLFGQVGIYSSIGQLYEPVDRSHVLYYKEAKNGQLLEEGITEAGSMSSFIAAGTAYSTHAINMIPFFFFYSMFGFQRIGDLIWASGDIRSHGFLIGGTSGRTTLSGEGLQHQDGHSHVTAMSVPNLKAYDPAFGHEIAVIVRDGLRRMHQNQEDLLYYLTVGNESYEQPPMPQGCEEGILKGIYLFKKGPELKGQTCLQLLGSGAILLQALKAQDYLLEKFQIPSDVWSVTSYKEVRQNALDTERWNWLHPEAQSQQPYVSNLFQKHLNGKQAVFVAASDYMKVLPDSISKWLPGPLISLGTDGFGRSGTREDQRDFFEVDYRHIAWAALSALNQQGANLTQFNEAKNDLKIDQEKQNPVHC